MIIMALDHLHGWRFIDLSEVPKLGLRSSAAFASRNIFGQQSKCNGPCVRQLICAWIGQLAEVMRLLALVGPSQVLVRGK